MSSFFDEYIDIGGSGGAWMSAAEKQVLIENGIPFQITEVADDDQNQYGPRYVLFVKVPDPETGEDEERKIGFAKVTHDEDGKIEAGVESRDRMLVQMQEYLSRDGSEPVTVKLTKIGRAQILQQA